MKFSVLINNFGYGHFLRRAVSSVQAQTRSVDEIVIVDDGSRDDSVAVARQLAAEDPRIVVVEKPNGGQLSAFHAGLAAASGDVICFLDADDEHLPGYLLALEQVYAGRPEVNFVYCNLEQRAPDGSSSPGMRETQSFDHGLSVLRTLVLADWVGSPTSGISARALLLRRFLPCNLENSWRIRADDVLVIGSGINMARKYYLAELLVRYHVHGSNHWHGGSRDATRQYRERIERRVLAGHFGRDLAAHFASQRSWMKWVLDEFQTIPRPRLRDAQVYARIVRRVPGRFRWFWWLRIHLDWLKRRNQGAPAQPAR